MTTTTDEASIKRQEAPTTKWLVARSHYANACKDFGKDSPEAQRLLKEYWCVKLCHTIAVQMDAHDFSAEQTHRIALTVFMNGRINDG